MAALDVPAGPVSDDEIRAAIRRYFAVLQSDPTAEQMRAEAVTDDFRTAMPDGGYQWDGPRGLETFLRDRKGFVDEQHDIDEVLSREDIGEVVWLKTRLTFHLRDPKTDEVFTGQAFHTWDLRRDRGSLRVAAQLVDGFAELNPAAQRLFARPKEGLTR
jgi:hypothetical protein